MRLRYEKMKKDEPFLLAWKGKGFLGENCSTWSFELGHKRENALRFPQSGICEERARKWAAGHGLKLHRIPQKLVAKNLYKSPSPR